MSFDIRNISMHAIHIRGDMESCEPIANFCRKELPSLSVHVELSDRSPKFEQSVKAATMGQGKVDLAVDSNGSD